MNHAFNTNHPKEYILSQQELLQLRPEHIYAFMAVQVYGKPDPTDDDNPTSGRSSSIEYHKKAIYYFMPNRLVSWNVESLSGNPTKSVLVNDLIKVVKKKEVRKEGKESSARRPMEQSEFQELNSRLRNEHRTPVKMRTMAAYFIYQYNMIGRVDDVAHFKAKDITPNVEYTFLLQSRMKWTKMLEKKGRLLTKWFSEQEIRVTVLSSHSGFIWSMPLWMEE